MNNKQNPKNKELKKSKDIKKYFPEWKDLKLSPKEGLFIFHYCTNNFNATKAYLEVYPQNISTASICACQVLRKPRIKEALKRYLNEYLNVKKEKLETEIFDIYYVQMTYDIAEILDNEGGLLKNLNEYTKEQRLCIEGIETKYYGKDNPIKVVTVKLVDRSKAADKLAKYIEMMKEVDTNIFVGIPDETMKKLEKLRKVNPVEDDIIEVVEKNE